jgi:hypothetical protein
MEKAFQLEPRETQAFALLERERKDALAEIGGLSLQMEAARKTLDTVMARQEAYLRNMLTNRGVDRYDGVQLANNHMIVRLPDLAPEVVAQVNGAA